MKFRVILALIVIDVLIMGFLMYSPWSSGVLGQCQVASSGHILVDISSRGAAVDKVRTPHRRVLADVEGEEDVDGSDDDVVSVAHHNLPVNPNEVKTSVPALARPVRLDRATPRRNGSNVPSSNTTLRGMATKGSILRRYPRATPSGPAPFEDAAQKFAESSNFAIFKQVPLNQLTVFPRRKRLNTIQSKYKSLLMIHLGRKRWNLDDDTFFSCHSLLPGIDLKSRTVPASDKILMSVEGTVSGCRSLIGRALRIVANGMPEQSKTDLVNKMMLLIMEREIWHTAYPDRSDTSDHYILGAVTDHTIQQLTLDSTVEFQRLHKKLVHEYREELECSAPVVYKLACPAGLKHTPAEIQEHLLEPLHCDSRNVLFEPGFLSGLIAMAPYVPATWLDTTHTASNPGGRRILIDFGANQFFGSPKWIADNHEAAGTKFDQIVLVEPRVENLKIASEYAAKYDIKLIKGVVWIALGKHNKAPKMAILDPVLLIEENCRKEDYCVVKFDVDRKNIVSTMEWGFMYSLISSVGALAVVDELYVELHFLFPDLGWNHTDHTMQQAIDLLKQLRKCGLAVHAWP